MQFAAGFSIHLLCASVVSSLFISTVSIPISNTPSPSLTINCTKEQQVLDARLFGSLSGGAVAHTICNVLLLMTSTTTICHRKDLRRVAAQFSRNSYLSDSRKDYPIWYRQIGLWRGGRGDAKIMSSGVVCHVGCATNALH